MPKWGLTSEQRRTKPWGLTDDALQPEKTITDPVQGDIYLTRIECSFVDSPPMQRLRRVRQLGTTHLVYPGASHTRFSHSLGALRTAQDLLDAVLDQRHGPHPVPDLFGEWEADPPTYERRVAEAIVLARLGALLHDLCHVPFGHSIEDDLGLLEAHDKNAARFHELWSRLPEELHKNLPAPLVEALRPLILSKEKVDNPPEPATRYPFVADIVGNTICADLLDYLPRDHYFTGLPAKFGHRFATGFYVTPSNNPYFKTRMAITIRRGGRERDDAVSELFKYLRYRYELSERVLVHHAKLAADAMVGKALEMWSDDRWGEEAAKRFPKIVELPVADIDALRDTLSKSNSDAVIEIDRAVRKSLESEFTRRGDDGLLESLLYEAERKSKDDRRMAGVAVLTGGLLYRRLFKMIGHCRSARANAKVIYETHGTPDARRRLERDAARFAGLDHAWKVVLWIPDPSMRLKAAEVLVNDGTKVSPLVELDGVRAKRGAEIYESHKALWGISVFVHTSVEPEQRHVLLARLASALGGLTWDGMGEQPTIEKLAAAAVARRFRLSSIDENRVAVRAQECSAYKGGETFAALVEQLADAVPRIAEQKPVDLFDTVETKKIRAAARPSATTELPVANAPPLGPTSSFDPDIITIEWMADNPEVTLPVGKKVLESIRKAVKDGARSGIFGSQKDVTSFLKFLAGKITKAIDWKSLDSPRLAELMTEFTQITGREPGRV